MDVHVIFSFNSNEFQALMQELKSQRVIITVFMEEMKNNLNPTWKTLEKGGNQGRKLLLSLKDNFLMNSRGNILITYGELVNFTAYLCRQRLDTFLPT